MTPDENKQFIQRFVEKTINGKNLDAINELVANDFIEHVPFPGQGPGRDGLRYAIGIFLSAFPDIEWTTNEQVGEGEKVVSRFTWTGTHRGDFLGIPPTGKSVKVWGVVMDLVRDGVLIESRIIMDTLGLLQQLGTIPAPEQRRSERHWFQFLEPSQMAVKRVYFPGYRLCGNNSRFAHNSNEALEHGVLWIN